MTLAGIPHTCSCTNVSVSVVPNGFSKERQPYFGGVHAIVVLALVGVVGRCTAEMVARKATVSRLRGAHHGHVHFCGVQTFQSLQQRCTTHMSTLPLVQECPWLYVP